MNTTAKLQDFMPRTGAEPMEFITYITLKGSQLIVSLPKAFGGKRFEAIYSMGQLIVAENKDDKGVKCTNNGTRYAAYFGRKKWVSGMPDCKFQATVKWQDGSFTVAVPQTASSHADMAAATASKITSVHERRGEIVPSTSPREQAVKCLDYLTKFAEKNGFIFVASGTQLALEKTDRICLSSGNAA